MPQAPTIGTASSSNSQQASVAFTPGATGGAAATYTAISNPGNITASGASSPITVTGLTNGTAYTFTVTATNSNGTSLASSASNSITPVLGDPGTIIPLASFTLSSAQTDVVFTNIPNTYKHLQIRGIYKSSASGMQLACYFNNTTPSTWFHEIAGSGSGNATAYASNGSYIGIGYAEQNQFSAIVMDVLDYANTNKNKTVRTLTGIDNNGSGYIFMRSSTWPSNNAVSEIKISTTGANNFTQFTSFQLYGIKG